MTASALPVLSNENRLTQSDIPSHSFAWGEIYLCAATLFRRFDFELCDVDRAVDVDVVRDCFLG